MTVANSPGKKRRMVNNCRRKLKYATPKDAKESARRIRKEIGEAIVVYKCPLTKGVSGGEAHYHVGHPPKREWSDDYDSWEGREGS